MASPYRVLEVSDEASDGAIRARYEELVRRFPPERAPDEFQRIRTAYETISGRRARLRFLLVDPSQGESLEEWIEEVRCEAKQRRHGLSALRRVYLRKK